jgi:hypothetical protein
MEVLDEGRQCNNQPNMTGSTRDGASRCEVTHQPAKQERLGKRRSRQIGGYAATSRINQGLNERQRHDKRQRQRHQQTTGGSATRGEGIANQEVPAKENKMQRCRQTRCGGLKRGGDSSCQDAVVQQEKLGASGMDC